ncbi:hypothetical protein G6M89_04460 [Natronolimnobius sp. AArcel1]|uniref:DUF7113 family protein n=1 Tax=Natronolimnobius sp. AArcel1 TaxID=1679093 RepID=UPI0013EC7812|nr:hypothetical protein [Natronolimnobius sp. AArcel1]NGM68268.1 hypothetical protein [Natronolimnobius sp. AArcel1]
MHIVRGQAGGTELTGTLYERGEQAPSFSGAPDQDAAYVWICDEFYEVDSGGSIQQLEDREINLAFESPLPRGFDTKEQALECAKEHIRTQFARIGINPSDVELEVETDADTESATDPDEQSVER